MSTAGVYRAVAGGAAPFSVNGVRVEDLGDMNIQVTVRLRPELTHTNVVRCLVIAELEKHRAVNQSISVVALTHEDYCQLRGLPV